MKSIHLLSILFLLLGFLPVSAGLPFKKDLAGDHELPLPLGISVDFFSMEQSYLIDTLEFSLGSSLPLEIPDTDDIGVDNDVRYYDIKFDAWLLPFLNIFAVVGDLDGETHVDFSALVLPVPLENLTIEYDGVVYGGGIVLAAGTERFFGSLTATATNTNLNGDFSSSVKAWTGQARFGYHQSRFEAWVGGMYLSAEENHKGQIEIPFLGEVDFDVTLAEKEPWNNTIGFKFNFSKRFEAIVEGGFGDRDTLLATIGYRF